MRFALLALVALGSPAFAVEPWADPKLPVTDGLELWLDASRIEAGSKDINLAAVANGKVQVWTDASGKRRNLVQTKAGQPELVKVGNAAVVRFDGVDDYVRRTDTKGELKEFTIFMVVAPRANPGEFRGFLALNAPDGRDYETGLTIDMGPGPTPRFSFLNVEGRGFGGAGNLLKNAVPFGQLVQLETRGEAKTVRQFVDGVEAGSRTRQLQLLSLDEITVGARFYTNGPGKQEVRGFAKCDIAEVLVFNRLLTDAETKQFRAYLDTKHAELKKALPPEPEAKANLLVPVKDPPPVQVLVPGFTVRQLPLDLTNVNNIKYRPDGTLVALCYNGDIWHLTDTNGDGLENKAELFYQNKGSLRGPIGMDLTPPNYKHGNGVFVCSKGKVSLIVDTDGDNKADKEIIVADGWKEITQSVDAIGVAVDPKDGSVYFGRGTANYANGYLLDNDGKAHYDIKDEYGTILKVSPDFKSREIICTGVRFTVGLHFNKHGDLFASDQEGATWLPNGNPFDELLHIQKGRHYGFPPRHPKHLPNVIDEPSVFDYGPQHQSTCGFCFNEPVKKDGPTFGPAAWAGDAFMTGESRGRIFRTQLVKTANGYVAKNQTFACLNMLTVDCCISPDGGLVVACHSGPPDWGTGPTGKGKLYKITYTDKEHPQPVLVYPSGPREVRVEFDRPVDPQLLRDAANQTKITAGKYVRAGDRFTSLWPPYAVVQNERMTPRFDIRVHSVQLTPDRRSLLLATDPLPAPVHYSLQLPGMGRPPLKRAGSVSDGALPQVPEIDLDFDLSGVEASWKGKDGTEWRGWLPHCDPVPSKAFTNGSAPHQLLWQMIPTPGELSVRLQLSLDDLTHPAMQPGSRLDYTAPEEPVSLVSLAPLEIVKFRQPEVEKIRFVTGGGRCFTLKPARNQPEPVDISYATSPTQSLAAIELLWATDGERVSRSFPLRRMVLPWVDAKAELGKPIPFSLPKELDGGSWARGRKLFYSEPASCFKCHSISGLGGAIGPDLTNLIHRDYASVLRDITQPSFAINPDYIPQTINLKDGRQLAGVIRTVDGKLHIGDAKGNTTIIGQDDVESIKPAAMSVMPDDLVKQLGPDRTKDLLTFLLAPPPSMPRDYNGPEKRPKPRTAAEVNAILKGAPNPPEKTRPIRVVLVAGAKDHGPGEHDYPAWQKAWKELLSAADNIEVTTAMEWPTKEEFQKADAMVFFQRGNWDANRAADIDAFLERGGGLTYLHWAVDGQKDSPGFAKRIGLTWGAGSKFRHGPLELSFNVDGKHPIGRNFTKLALVDESYWNLTGELPKERILATAVEDKQPQPLFWTLEHGKGRVFVSIPGHYSWSFDDPLFRVLLLRGIAWTAREPVDRFNDLVWPGADVAK
jgi:putative heme-binding domain-containing protein